MGRKGSKSPSADKKAEHLFRYWVEIRDLSSGTVRQLPLIAVKKIPLIRRGKEEPPPAEECLQVTDGTSRIEAATFDDLTRELRERYPDESYERTLHSERDEEAERRRAAALDALLEILVQAALKDLSETAGDE